MFKPGASNTEEQQATNSSKKQVVPYRTLYQMRSYVENKLGLRQVYVQDLPNQDNLDGCYFGGRIVNVVPSSSRSQGGGSIVFVKDNDDLGMDTLHGVLQVSQELMDQLPTLDNQFMLFVSGASLEEVNDDEEQQFTQETGKDVIVEGSGVTLWIVHPRINDPKIYQKNSFHPDWWVRAKRKKNRKQQAKEAKAQRERERLAASVAENQEHGRSKISTVGDGHKEERDLSSKPGPSSVSMRESSLNKPGPSHIHGINGEADKALEDHQQTFYDDNFHSFPDFPDSAFSGSQGAQHMNEDENREREGGSKSSDSDGSSSSSWRGSDSDGDSTASYTDIAWSPSKRSKISYKYTKLGDLQPDLKKVNVFGVVKEFSEPRITRGTEYCSFLTLLDETDPSVGVKCIMFNSKKERLPHVKREGDIICLHRVNTNDYRNMMQIEGPPYCGSLRFSSKIGQGIKPSTGSLSYTLTTVERHRVRELRQWVQKMKTEHALKLEAIREGQKCDLLCQVVWIAQLESTNQIVLSVWDGSVCPLVIKSFDIADADIRCDAGLNAAIGPKLQQQIIIQSKPSRAQKLRPGSYVHLSNLEVSTANKDGVTELSLTRNPQENIKIISAKDHGYSELRDRLDAGLASQNVVTIATTIHNHIPLSPLQEVKDYDVQEDTPSKFHCTAKLVCVLTPTLEETVRLKCERCGLFEPIPKSMKVELESGQCLDPCPRCSEAGGGHSTASESPTLHCMFLIQVLLADHTASLEVYIPHDEAGPLFGGIKPTNFYQHQSVRYHLMTKFYQLSGGNPPFNHEIDDTIRPWIDCSLLKVKEGEEIAYCMFDTAIK